jgi:hypothetical protein
MQRFCQLGKDVCKKFGLRKGGPEALATVATRRSKTGDATKKKGMEAAGFSVCRDFARKRGCAGFAGLIVQNRRRRRRKTSAQGGIFKKTRGSPRKWGYYLRKFVHYINIVEKETKSWSFVKFFRED